MTLTTRAFGAAALLAVAAFQAQAAEFNTRLHTLVTSPHPYNDMAALFKERVEAESDGRIAVEIFPSGTLGQDPAVIDELRLGTIDFMISTTNNAAKQVPEYQIFSLPYLWSGYDQFEAAVAQDSPVFERFEAIYDERDLGLKLLALTGAGTRNLSTAVRPVEGLDDIDGLKMRVPPSPMLGEIWQALGTLPVTVSWGELYAAVQTGVAEALESSISGYTGSKLYEVAPYLALTGHEIQVGHFTMSERSWEKLPEDLRQVVQDAAIAAAELGLEQGKEADRTLVDQLASEHGVTVTEPDTAPFQDAVQPLHDKFAQDMGAGDLLDLIRSL